MAVSVKTGVTLALCLLECLLFGGTIYGWPSLVYIYKDQKILAHLCDNAANVSGQAANSSSPDPSGCPAQDGLLSLAFTLGVAMFGLSGLPSGIIFDRLGLRFVRTIAIVAGVLACMFLALVSEGGFSYFIFPGAILMGISCPLIIMTSSHVAGLAGPRTVLFINLYCGIVDSSGIVFFFVKLAYDSGVSHFWSLVVVACLWLVVLSTTFFLMPRFKVNVLEAVKVTDEDTVEEKETASGRGAWRPLLFTWRYISHVAYYCALNMCVTMVIGSMNTWLNYITDYNDKQVSSLTNMYAYIQFGLGILLPPFAGLLTDWAARTFSKRSGCAGAERAVVTAPGLLVASLCACATYVFTLVAAPWSAYPVFVFNEVIRAFFYGNATVYIARVFPAERFGLLFGLMYAVNGVGLSVQYGYTTWLLHSGFVPVSALILVTAAVSLLHPAWMAVSYARSSPQRNGAEIVCTI